MSDPKPLKARKREAIVAAAQTLFVDLGYQQTSMEAIAARAEVSKRTLYNHFASKEALFYEIAEQLWQAQIRAKRLSYAADQPLDTQLRQMARQYLEVQQSETNLQLSRVVLAEMLHAPELAQKIMDNLAASDSLLPLWIQSAIDDGRLREHDARFSATQFWSLLKAFSLWPQLLMGAEPLDRERAQVVIDSAIEMFLRHYQPASHTQ